MSRNISYLSFWAASLACLVCLVGRPVAAQEPAVPPLPSPIDSASPGPIPVPPPLPPSGMPPLPGPSIAPAPPVAPSIQSQPPRRKGLLRERGQRGRLRERIRARFGNRR